MGTGSLQGRLWEGKGMSGRSQDELRPAEQMGIYGGETGNHLKATHCDDGAGAGGSGS